MIKQMHLSVQIMKEFAYTKVLNAYNLYCVRLAVISLAKFKEVDQICKAEAVSMLLM